MKNVIWKLLAAIPLSLLLYLSVNAGQSSDSEPFVVPDGLYQARFIENRDNVSIIEFSGDYNRDLVSGGSNTAARAVVAQEFYRHHVDQYDFLVIFSDFEYDTGDALAFYSPVANDTEGLGVEIFDNSTLFGSDGELEGIIDMGAVSRYELNPLSALNANSQDNYNLVLSTLAHETLHRWAVYSALPEIEGRDGAHWSFFLDTDGSVQYGNDWQDNGDGTFTAGAASRSFYSPLDLYLMGLRSPESVPDTFVITPNGDEYTADDLPSVGTTIAGSKQVFRVEDLISENGPRVPAATDSQTEFRYAFIYLTTSSSTPTSLQTSQIEQVSQEFAQRFSILTGGAAVANIYPRVSPVSGPGSFDVINGSGQINTEELDLEAAVTWLQAQQETDGSWLDKPSTAIRDTALVRDILKDDPNFTAPLRVENASRWLSQQQTPNHDSAARVMASIDVASEQLLELFQAQNTDAGWGLTDQYESNPLDTILAFRSLSVLQEELIDQVSDSLIAEQQRLGREVSQNSLGFAIQRVREQLSEVPAYLEAAQNDDGSWGYSANDSGSVHITAEVLLTLEQLELDGLDIVENAINWIVQQQNFDGGFGVNESTLQETALSLTTLVELGAIGRIDPLTSVMFLEDRQYESGSWEASVYTTALVLQAARSVSLPNITVSNITRSNDLPLNDGERVVLTVDVINDGEIPVDASVLRFYLGDPIEGGIEFLAVDVPSLAALSKVTVRGVWDSFGHDGSIDIFVLADSDNTILERLENDNTQSINLRVEPAPDGVELEINSDEFLIQPDRPNILPSTLALSAIVRNNGTENADNITVELYQEGGSPQDPSILIDSQAVSVAGRSSVGVNFSAILDSPGTTRYQVTADAQQVFAEQNEQNNSAYSEVTTVDSIDLAAESASITQSPNQLFSGANAEFQFEIANIGTVSTTNASLRASIVNEDGETELLSSVLLLAPGERKIITAQWLVDYVGQSSFVVELDSEGLIAETNENNNRASIPVSSEQLVGVNLTTSFQDIQINPNPGLEGLGASISTVIRNSGSEFIDAVQVSFYDGEPQLGNVIGATTVTNIDANSIKPVSVVWPQINGAGPKFIHVVLDANGLLDETDETDNSAFVSFEVQSLADLALSANSIQATPAFPRVNELFNVNVNVSNLGNQAAENVDVLVYEGDPNSAGSILLHEQQVSIGSASDTGVSFQHQFLTEGLSSIFVVIDPNNLLLEMTKDNNRANRQFVVQSSEFYVSDQYLSPNDDGEKESVDYGFNLPEIQAITVVVLDRYDDEVAELTLPNSELASGVATWDGRNNFGSIVADGRYQIAVKTEAGVYLGQTQVIVDTNRSPLSEAISTEFALFENRSCDFGETTRSISTRAEQSGYRRLVYGPLGQNVYFGTFFRPRVDSDGNAVTVGGFSNQRHTRFPTGIYRANIDGSGVQQLIGDSPVSGFDLVDANSDRYVLRLQNIVVSDDGLRLLLELSPPQSERARELWTMDASGGDLRKITTLTSNIDSISYIGESIYFTYRPDNGPRALWRLNDSANSSIQKVYEFIETGRFFLDEPEVTFNRTAEYSLIHGQPSSINSNNRNPIGARLEVAEYSLNHFDIAASLVTESLVTVHAWAPNQQIYAAADSRTGNINVMDSAGRNISIIDVAELARRQFTSEEWSRLQAYLNETSELSDRSFFAVIDHISWNPDSSEFAFYLSDRLPDFYFEDGCQDDGYGEIIGCREMPADIRPLIERYRSLDGIFVAETDGSRITKVASGEPSIVNGPDQSARSNNHGVDISVESLPIVRFVSSLEWLTGARELIVERSADGNSVLLDLDFPENNTRPLLDRIFVRSQIAQRPSGKRLSYQGLEYTEQIPTDLSNLPRSSDFCGFSTDHIQLRSLLNLSTDLRARRSGRSSGVVIEGTATDKNFLEYRLEFQDADSLGEWASIAPPSQTMVIDDVFTTWVAPYIGRFNIRLTVVDKAGNEREQIRPVNNNQLASISSVQLTPQDFSPNGDGVLDDVSLSFRVLENVNVVVDVFNDAGIPVRQYIESYDVVGSQQEITWDGRDETGAILDDGTYRLVIQGFEYFVDLDNTKPDINDLTPPLFVPLLESGGIGNCRDFAEGEIISESDFELLEGCVVSVRSDVVANASDLSGLVEVRLERQKLNSSIWEVLDLEQTGQQQVTIAPNTQLLDDLSDHRYRLVAIDTAGNSNELLLKDRRNLVHITEGSEGNPYSFRYQQHTDFGIAESRNSGDILTQLGLSEEEPHRITFSHTFDELESLTILFKRKDGSNTNVQARSLPFEVVSAGPQAPNDPGVVTSFFAPELISSDGGEYEAQFRLTSSSGDTGFTDQFDLTIGDPNNIARVTFLSTLGPSALEPASALHEAHYFTEGASGTQGLHAAISIDIPIEQISDAYLEVQSIGGGLIDQQFIEKTRVFGEGVLTPTSTLTETVFNIHDLATRLNGDCGYQYELTATFVTQLGRRFEGRTLVSGACVDITAIVSPDESSSCDNVSTNRLKVRLNFRSLFTGRNSAETETPLTLILGTPRLNVDGSEGFDEIYFVQNFPVARQSYRTFIDTQSLPEGQHRLRAELIFEDGTREVENFSAPIVHTTPSMQVNFPTQDSSICAVDYLDSSENAIKAIEIQGEILSDGPSFFTAAPERVNQRPADPRIRSRQTFVDAFAEQDTRAAVIDPFFYRRNERIPVAGDREHNPIILPPEGLTRVSDGQKVVIQNARFDPIEGRGVKQGVIGFASGFGGRERQTLELQVSNWSGAKFCRIIDVNVDAGIDGFNFELGGGRSLSLTGVQENRHFSPRNQDGNYDNIEFSYSVEEAVRASLSIFSIPECDADRCLNEDIDFAEENLVVNLLDDSTILEGSYNLNWSGLNEAGDHVDDGAYIAHLTMVDDCGNTVTGSQLFFIDNTPPEVSIAHPFDGASLPSQVAVLGSVRDERFIQSYSLNVIDRRESETRSTIFRNDWDQQNPIQNDRNLLFNFVNGDAAELGVLGSWDTAGLIGTRFLELESMDAVGNTSRIEVPITVPDRQTLISSHDVADFFVSPNEDARFDELIVRTSFNVGVSATYEILDFTNRSVIATFVNDRAFNVGFNTIRWNGQSDAGAVAADGLYYVRVTATALGQVESQEAVFEIDTTPPQIDLTRLVDGYIALGQSRDVLGNISDKNLEDSNVSLVSSVLDTSNPNRIDRPLIVNQSGQNSFGVLATLPESLFSNEAIFDVSFMAIDKAGNRALQEWPMLIDLHPPEIIINSPVALTHFNLAASPVRIIGEVTDTNLRGYRVSLSAASNDDESEVIHQSNVATTQEITRWNLANLDDGIYTLRVDADDRSGRTSTKSLELVVDNTPPEVDISAPELNEYLTRVKPTLGTASDLNLERYTLSIAEGRVDINADFRELFTSDKSVQGGVLYNPTQLPDDGMHTYHLLAQDVAGNTSTTIQHFNVDTVPPEPPVLESVEYDNSTDEVSITWLAVDTPDVIGYNLYRNNIKVNEDVIPDLTLVERGLSEGSYRYYVTSVDNAGLESENSNALSVVVDITPPLAIIGSPADGSTVNLLVDINGTAFSEDDFKEYRLYVGVNETQLELVRTSGLPISVGELFQWNTLGLIDGQQYLVRLEAEDIRGNIASDEIRLTVDNEAPEAPINLSLSLSNDNDIALTWEHPIPGEDLDGYLVYRNGRLVNATGVVIGDLNQYAIEPRLYDDLNVVDGEYEYQVSAIDLAGNVSSLSNIVNQRIDLRAPHAFFVNINEGDEFENSLFIITDSEDLDIANIEISFRFEGQGDWQPLVVDSSAPYEYLWETQDIAYGPYQLRALATDTFGNTDPSPEIVNVVKTDLVIPNTLTDLEVTVLANEGRLSWPESSDDDVVGYHIYRRCDFCTDLEQITEGALVDVNSYVDTVTDSIIYHYGVSAVDETGNESILSDQVKAIYFDTFLSVDNFLTLADNVGVSVSHSPVMVRNFGSITTEVLIDEGELNVNLANGDLVQTPLIVIDQQSTQLNTGVVLGENNIAATVSAQNGKFIAQSSETLTVIKSEKPSAPTNLTALANQSNDNVEVEWSANPANESVVAYRVYRDDVPLNEISLIEDSTAQTSNGQDPTGILPSSPVFNSWRGVDTGVTVGQSWSDIRLVSRIELDWRSRSSRAEELSIFALVNGENVRIQDYTVDESETPSGSYVIEFTQPIPTSSIDIQIRRWRFSSGQLSQMRIFASDLQQSNSGFRDQPGDGIYRYSVSAFNQYGFESDRTDTTTDTPVGDVSAPDPVVLSLSVVNSTANLSWNSVADAVAYNVYRDGVLLTKATTTAHQDQGLANGTYLYTVTALDAVENESEPSNEAEALINIPALSSPVNLAAQGSLERAESSLSWEHVSAVAASSFNVYRSLESGVNFEFLASTTEQVYLDTSVELDIVYYYHVVAVDQFNNESVASNEASAISSDETAPSIPVITTPTRSGVDFRAADDLETIAGLAEPDASVFLLQQGVFALEPTRASALAELANLGSQRLFSASPTGRVVVMPDRSGEFYLLQGDQVVLIEGLSSLVGGFVNTLLWTAEGDLLIEQSDEFHLYNFSSKQLIRLELNSDNRQIFEIYAYSIEANTVIASASINGGSRNVYQLDLSTFDAQVMPRNRDFRSSQDGKYFVYGATVNGSDVTITVLNTQTLVSHEFILPLTRRVREVFEGRNVFSVDGEYIKLVTISGTGARQTQVFELATGDLVDTIAGVGTIWLEGQILSYIEQDIALGDYNIVQRNINTQNSEILDTILASSGVIPVLRAHSDSGLPIVLDRNTNATYYAIRPMGWFQFDNRRLDNGENIFSVIAVDQALNRSRASTSITVLYQREPVADLSVELTPNPANPVFGRDVNLVVNVLNLGELGAPQNVLSVRAFDVSGNETLIFEQTVDALAAADSRQLDIAWKPSSVGRFNVIATVDAAGEVDELSEANNSRISSVDVRATADPFIAVSLNESNLGNNQFFNNENVNGLVTITNPGLEFNGTALIEVVDAQGIVVEELSRTAIIGLDFSETRELLYDWFTGLTFAGEYKIRARLVNDQNSVLSEAQANISIRDPLQLLLGVSSDALTYMANQDARLRNTLVNNSLSSVFDGGELVTEVASSQGAMVFRESYSVGQLIASDRLTQVANWNVGSSASGDYLVTTKLYLGASVVAQASTRVEVVSALVATIEGSLELNEVRPVRPEPLTVQYELSNTGGIDLEQTSIELQLLTNGGQMIRTLEQDVTNFTIGSTAEFSSTFATDDLVVGFYQVRMVARYRNELDVAVEQVIEIKTFELIEANPPVISIGSPTPNQILNSDRVLGAVTVSDDTQLGNVEIRLDQNIVIAESISISDQYSLSLSSLSDGARSLSVGVSDVYNNNSTQNVNFVVDNTPPEISLVNVSDAQVFSGPISPNVTILDEHLGERSILLNGIPYQTGNVISDIGLYEIVITATDQAGNTSSLQRSFEIRREENPEPEPEPEPESPFVVRDDVLNVQRNVSGTVRVFENDQIPFDQGATVNIISRPERGSIVVANEGVFNFISFGRYLGPDEFTYEVGLDDGRTQSATVLIDIFPGLSCSEVDDHGTSTSEPIVLPRWARAANDVIDPPLYRIEILSVSNPLAFVEGGIPRVTYPGCDLIYQAKLGSRAEVTVSYQIVDVATNGSAYTSRRRTFTLRLDVRKSGDFVIIPVLQLLLDEEDSQ